ncbi:hypothetical protein [Streptomyces sp. NPDC004658]|uniref:Uncharacterized protein n=1 Tax=Streptomyces sp. F12 TaxID=1436084 RepID=V9Z7V8_9ACTN|nr:hypothetical protein pFRL6_116 [Streptomyces sp. F12]
MAEPHFTDPELTAIWAYLRPSSAEGPSPAHLARATRHRTPNAQAIAAREGLDLGPELQRVIQRSRTAAPRTRSPRRDAGPRPAERSRVKQLIATLAPRMRQHLLRERTAAWAALGLTLPELETWMRALGVDGAATVQACKAWGVGLAALDVVLDGRQVRRRLREGTTVTSLLALASERGIDLRRR